MGEEIQVFDLQRMLLGDHTWWFTAEVIVRTVVMYLYTLALVRLLGKRGMGQLAPFELVIIIALGSAVGDPMFYPDVPLIHAFAVITAVVGLQRALVFFAERSPRIDRALESAPARIVHDGRLDMQVVDGEHLPKDEIFTALRREGIEHLGQVRLAYLEPNGHVSVYRFAPEDIAAGLSLQPASDPDALRSLPVGSSTGIPGNLACITCGLRLTVSGNVTLPECANCGRSDGWQTAVFNIQSQHRTTAG